MMLFESSGERVNLSDPDLASGLREALRALGPKKKVLILPPDGTRAHSKAHFLTVAAHGFLGTAVVAVIPALGTHQPLRDREIASLFPGVPRSLFLAHDWRSSLARLGTIEANEVAAISEGAVSIDVPFEVNRLLVDGGFDLVISPGQVVPHEVAGFANHAKNLFVGLGGDGTIHASHWISAMYGIERTLGVVETPVRRLFDLATERFIPNLEVLYALTVVEALPGGGDAVRGLFVGTGRECFERAAALSSKVNVKTEGRRHAKVVAFMDGNEFRSTWLANKAVYRTRMLIEDGGELVILAGGVWRFGEDAEIDALIRKFGYRSRTEIEALAGDGGGLSRNLAAAAHLVHGSPEGRFRVTYAAGGLTPEELVSVGYGSVPFAEAITRYDPSTLSDGLNSLSGGDEVFFVRSPSLGLWRA